MHNLSEYLPFWKDLTDPQRTMLETVCHERTFPRGAVLHNGQEDCVGLLLVLSGQLRVYTVSEEGRELTLFRLLERDMCLLSASCILRSIQFEVTVCAERETTVLHIPPEPYRKLMGESAPVAGFTNELMASRFTDVMWLMEQILYKKLDSRLAAFLLEQSDLDASEELEITHEQIAGHLGTMREVITRMLRYFRSEHLVELSRGCIRIIDRPGLEELARSTRQEL